MKITITHNGSSITYEEQRVQNEYYAIVNCDENTRRILSLIDKMIEGVAKLNPTTL